ncbi:o-succinylbenzoate--CoA ligase [Caldibacillus lycopersici]|uniref:2-succinylbenzoate--CoA ligase n=1 Tax=Perspicuibacillus lycopersici TaxID=1325689 RepID=A0AAE3ITN9_9BACI|nr:o-succinylbenzoate--CoA ligase [Perspicuibacillus lycopersici]MCU9614296.1 o-succinylbenzoate--CoA ligase [Perspicuibacillus lycopersici]
MSSLEKMPNWLLNRAYLTPNRKALVFKDKELTFKELCDYSLSMARKLTACGIKRGDRTAVLLNNHMDFVLVLYALQLIGCPVVLLNVRLTNRELAFQIDDSEAVHLITQMEFESIAVKLNGQTGIHTIYKEQLIAANEVDFEIVTEFNLQDVCTIMYTSGTTGFPKGVIQSFGNHWWSAIGSALNLGLHDQDAWLAAVPLFHASGFSILVRSMVYGIPVILFEKFDEQQINLALMEGKATIISVVTSMLQNMIRDLGEKTYSPSFRCMLIGGGPVPLSLLQVCKNKNIPVFQTYGMTETASQIVTLTPEDSLAKLGSAGKPLFFCQVRIDKDGVAAMPNEIGEIVVKGPNVTYGYYNREDANKRSFTNDGWFYTGDVGYMDEDGFLFVIDRRSDLIISGGENIYPAEIENIILSHPAIKEAAVIGMDDETWGQVPCAFYVVANNAEISGEQLAQFCQPHLAKYKVPKKWIQINELPKTASNKVMRKSLSKFLS